MPVNERQLRNLVVCPKDQGVVWYVSETAIVEQDVRAVDSVSSFDIIPSSEFELCATYRLHGVYNPTSCFLPIRPFFVADA